MKWQPEHFPRGTVVEYCIGSKNFNETKTDVVKNIVQNGVDSYCIQTDTWDERTGINTAFNIDHVTKIVKRGKGGMKYSVTADYPVNKSFQSTTFRKAKSKYQCLFGIEMYVTAAVLRHIPEHGKIFDFDKMRECIYSVQNPLGIRRRVLDENIGIYVHDVSKKKVKRWLKQNINRFLKKKSVAIEEEQGVYHDSLDTSFDRDLAWREPSQEGSFYLDDLDE